MENLDEMWLIIGEAATFGGYRLIKTERSGQRIYRNETGTNTKSVMPGKAEERYLALQADGFRRYMEKYFSY